MDMVADEQRLKTAYARLFDMARRNIMIKRHLTNDMTQKYTKVQYGRKIFNNRGSSQEVTS